MITMTVMMVFLTVCGFLAVFAGGCGHRAGLRVEPYVGCWISMSCVCIVVCLRLASGCVYCAA